jgi:curved DNA-binding protein CbpA
MNENFVDYYKVLNIDIEASSTEIKNSYLKLAKKHHPDHSNGGNSNLFQLICNAYECLYNKDKRKEYDLIYLKRSFDELKDDNLVKFRGEFNEFVSTTVKPLSKDKIDEIFSEIFKDTEELKEKKFNDIELEKRLVDISLERETQDIENKDDSIKELLDKDNEIDLNDIFEYKKSKTENNNIINKDVGTVDLLYFDKFGSYELLNSNTNENNREYLSNIYSNIGEFNVNTDVGGGKISYEDIKEWKNKSHDFHPKRVINNKLSPDEIEEYIKMRRKEENSLLEDVEKNFVDNKKKREINSFIKNEFNEELELVEKLDNIKKRI